MKIRTFTKYIEDGELKWHWDESDRHVKILNNTDWKFQFDNCLPFKLQKGQILFIEEGRLHRVIKGTTRLIIEIDEN